MRRKILAMLIVCVFCVFLVVPIGLSAAVQNYTVFSDGFEGDMKFTESFFSPTAKGETNADKYGGTKSYMITSDGGRTQTLSKTLYLPLNEKNCSFSAYVKASNTHPTKSKGVKIQVTSKSQTKPIVVSETLYDTSGGWTKLSVSFTLATGYRQPLEFSLIWSGKGTVYWDDVNVHYEIGTELASEQKFSVVPDTPEIPQNTTFEKNSYVGITSGGYTSELSRSGSQSLMLINQYGTRCAWESGYGCEPLATYRFSIWSFIPTQDMHAYAVIMFAPASDRYNILRSIHIDLTKEYGRWAQTEVLVTAPLGTGYWQIDFYASGTNGGKCYLDDLSFRKNAESAHGTFELDETYYYTDAKKATATFSANTEAYDPYGWECALTVKKAGVSSFSETKTLVNGKADFEIPLPEGKDDDTYTATLTVRSGKTVLNTFEDVFYKMFDRPKNMTEKGAFLDENGEPFNPSIAYWAYENQWPLCREMGITVVELAVLDNLYEAEKTLTLLQDKYGLKAMVGLYSGETSSGENLELTRQAVNALKHHPAVWGWCIDDEPVAKSHNLDNLKKAYELIRKLDPDRPVFTCDMYPRYYKELIQITDILGTDCYPYYRENAQAHIGDCLTEGQEYIAYNNKGMIPVIQFFNRQPEGGDYDYLPSPDELQNFIYQSFFTGATGLAYYAFAERVGDKFAYQTEMADGLREFAKNDQDIMFDAFVHGKYETVTEVKDTDVWYRIFKEKEGPDYFIAAMNRSFYNSASKTINVSQFWDSAVIVDAGDTKKSETCLLTGGNLTVNLPKAGTTLTRIIPLNGVVAMKDGKKLEHLENGTISLYFEETTKSPLYIAALYDNTSGIPQLQQMDIFTKSEAEIQIMDIHNKELKLFVWTKDGLKPLSEPFKYKNKQEVKE